MLFTLIFICYTLVLFWIYGMGWLIVNKTTIPLNVFYPIFPGIAVLGFISLFMVLGGRLSDFTTWVVLLGAFVIVWRYLPVFKVAFKNVLSWYTSINSIKYLLLGLLVIISFQSSQFTRINDMGMYYLQTLRWFREYGVVPGVGNLHPALGLGSIWHSLLVMIGNFALWDSFQVRLFGINGTLVISFFLWFVAETRLNRNYLLLFFAFPFAFLGYMYLTAPSPDLPVILYTFLLFYMFLNKEYEQKFLEILLFALFVFACKPPALLSVGVSVVSLILGLVRTEKKLFQQVVKVLLLLLITLGPLFYKNYIQTGYPLYPAPLQMKQLGFNNPDWMIPTDWNAAYRNGIQTFGVNDKLDKKSFSKPKLDANRLNSWISRNGYKGMMNRFLFFNFCLSIILMIWVIKKKDKFLIYLLLMLVQIIEWYYLSQYRLMLPTGMCLFYFNMVQLVNSPFISTQIKRFSAWFSKYNSFKVIDYYMFIVLLIYCGITFVPIKILYESSRNKEITSFGNWSSATWIKPWSNYQFGVTDSFGVNGKFLFFYSNETYMWDCKLPAMSQGQQFYTKEIYHYIPGSRGNEWQNGIKFLRDTLIINE